MSMQNTNHTLMTLFLLSIAALLLGACPIVIAQSSYKGLTPGRSVRPEVERVLGGPLKEVSQTLIEYKPVDNLDKVYVQYRDPSATAVVERIEFVRNGYLPDGFFDEFFKQAGVPKEKSEAEAEVKAPLGGLFKSVSYYGSPMFLVFTDIHDGRVPSQSRVGLYTRELYENTLPKGCTGRLWGIWETNRGRLTLTRHVADFKTVQITGTYTKNNGSLQGAYSHGAVNGEWKDDTGSGTLFLYLQNTTSAATTSFTLHGSLDRKTGTGPSGRWEGRCVEE